MCCRCRTHAAIPGVIPVRNSAAAAAAACFTAAQSAATIDVCIFQGVNTLRQRITFRKLQLDHTRVSLGPFHGAIAVPSVTRCRCCCRRRRCRGHRCAGGVRQYRHRVNGNVKLGRSAAHSGEWAQHFSNASCLKLEMRGKAIARSAPQCRPLASSSETKPCHHLANLQRMHIVSVCLHYGRIISSFILY